MRNDDDFENRTMGNLGWGSAQHRRRAVQGREEAKSDSKTRPMPLGPAPRGSSFRERPRDQRQIEATACSSTRLATFFNPRTCTRRSPPVSYAWARIFLETMGIHILQGRGFNAHDNAKSAKVEVVNRARWRGRFSRMKTRSAGHSNARMRPDRCGSSALPRRPGMRIWRAARRRSFLFPTSKKAFPAAWWSRFVRLRSPTRH